MLVDVIESLRSDRAFFKQVTHWEVMPAREGKLVDIPPEVDGRIVEALAARGIRRLYSHQAATFHAVRGGKSVVLVSPTASGKTLIAELSGLKHILEKNGKVIYLTPLRALANE